MSFAAFLLGLLKAIPAAQKIFSQMVDLYFAQQEAADINYYDKKKVIRDSLIARLKPGVSEDEAKNIRRALYELRND